MSSKKGGWLEDDIKAAANAYAAKGVLSLEKVDPPTRIIRGRVIFMANPFLDFVGTWTERQGRAIFLEAKSTEKPKLEFGKGGITDAQVESLRTWRKAGAAVGTLWGYSPTMEVRWVPLEALEAQVRSGTRHLKWEHATAIPAGFGFIRHDWVRMLRAYFPETGTIRWESKAA